MNIDISELLALDAPVNEIACLHHLPPSFAAFCLFNDIREYSKIGGSEKELERLLTQVFAVKECWLRQNQSMMAVLRLQTHGITEGQIISLNNFLESNNYKINLRSSS
jgi:hypothetical protein